MYFYLTQANGNKWHTVDAGPYTKEQLTAAILKQAEACQNMEDAIILGNTVAVASAKRINVNKNIRNDWIAGHNDLSDPESIKDKTLRTALITAFDRVGYQF